MQRAVASDKFIKHLSFHHCQKMQITFNANIMNIYHRNLPIAAKNHQVSAKYQLHEFLNIDCLKEFQ